MFIFMVIRGEGQRYADAWFIPFDAYNLYDPRFPRAVYSSVISSFPFLPSSYIKYNNSIDVPHLQVFSTLVSYILSPLLGDLLMEDRNSRREVNRQFHLGISFLLLHLFFLIKQIQDDQKKLCFIPKNFYNFALDCFLSFRKWPAIRVDCTQVEITSNFQLFLYLYRY